MNRAKEFQRGTAGVPESAKECDTVLPEGLDIGLGPGDRSFESHYSDHMRRPALSFRFQSMVAVMSVAQSRIGCDYGFVISA